MPGASSTAIADAPRVVAAGLPEEFADFLRTGGRPVGAVGG